MTAERSRLGWAGIAALLLATGVTLALRGPGVEESQAPVAAPRAALAAQVAAKVAVAELSARPFVTERRFSGEVWAISDATLTVGEEGRVRRVLVAEGARVRAGQLLLELDDGLARAELGRALADQDRARTLADQARREADRFSELGREQVISTREQELEGSEASARSAERAGATAAVSVMNERVQRHRIVAPFAGTVTRRHVDPGDWLKPGEAALELLTQQRVEVLVRVPAEVLPALDERSEARLISGQQESPAVVTSRVPALDRQTRTALVRLEPRERPDWMLPGSSVQVAFRTERRDGLTVPRDALVYGVANVRVVKVKDGKAVPVPVEVVDAAGDSALIRAGELAIGDQLVVRGNERLRPGQSVTVEGALYGQPDGAPGHEKNPG